MSSMCPTSCVNVQKTGTMTNVLFSKKVLVSACVSLLLIVIIMYTHSQHSIVSIFDTEDSRNVAEDKFVPKNGSKKEPPKSLHWNEGVRKDKVDNSGGIAYLNKYERLFRSKNELISVPANPNNPDTITTWWQAAAMMDWYINSPIRYKCRNRVPMGNWHICQDEPFTVRAPCLVYSFGINFDFTFDDAMVKLGCDVHSFDPSMKTGTHKRINNSTFYNIGLGSSNTDAYVARSDMYVTEKQVWKMRTVKTIMKELGHENRVIDVFKMDIEGYEWAVLDNMMETGVFKYIRQYMLEFHLFPKFPLKEEYVHLYKIYTRLREMGFREYGVGPHPFTLDADKYNIQGDSEYVNIFFSRT